MTTRLDFATMRMANDEAVRAEDVRRRFSGFHYWLVVPFAGMIIYAAVIWAIFSLIWPSGWSRDLLSRL